jgi:dihydrofolate synthase/folylpolyglutamate synthase
MDQAASGSSTFRSLDEWLIWLETLSPSEIELGLDRVSQVLDRLRPSRPGRVIHIAGTNGKGSSAAMLESLFISNGDRVGTYTSPHVNRYNERIRVDGTPVSDGEIISSFERVEAARSGLRLTYFEFGTLAAILVFEAREVDTIILEVGMGGRLDAVNAIEPDAGIITNVSLDHCDWLGEDIESIAVEKAGILRSDKPFVFGSKTVPDSIRSRAEELGADLRLPGIDYDYTPELDSAGTWAWSGRRHKLTSLAPPALAGAFQLKNAAPVLALLEAMHLDALLDRDLINSAFASLELAGRCQLIEADRNWLLDVAHNAEAAAVLSRHLANNAPAGKTVAIIGMLADKDQTGIISPLETHVDVWVAVTASGGRAALPAGELAASIARACDKPCLIADSLADALQYASDQTTDRDLILVTGSFYVVGPALKWLDGRAYEPLM